MSKWLWLLPAAVGIFTLAGCDDGYSESARYNVRTDPILNKTLGDEYVYPDQPGQLPVLAVTDFLDVRNPYYKKNREKDLVKDSVFIDPLLIADSQRQEIRTVLDELFGTPAKPKVGEIDDDLRETLKLSEPTLAQGSKLYRLHCLHCHGVTGDGRGPTARWVNPHPRDYRQGRFKFQSVDQTKGASPPRRDDLLRALEIGLEGTAMPSFIILPQAEREALVSYVIHLSMRGNAEFYVMKDAFELDSATGKMKFKDIGAGGGIADTVKALHRRVIDEWTSAQDPKSRIQVKPYPYDPSDMKALEASARRGKDYFFGNYKGADKELGKNACNTCHRDYGRQSTFRHDEWGTFAKPNNFANNVFRGGRRPVDIYYRIHSGISPSAMIPFGKLLADPSEKESKLWDLVNFVQVVGNPNMRKQFGINID